MSYKSELIRKLFSDRLKKDELKDLSEIDMIERKMKVQWEEQNPIAENSERVDPVSYTHLRAHETWYLSRMPSSA